MAIQENVLVLRRCMLKNLELKSHDVANLLLNGLGKEIKVHKERDKTSVAKY